MDGDKVGRGEASCEVLEKWGERRAHYLGAYRVCRQAPGQPQWNSMAHWPAAGPCLQGCILPRGKEVNSLHPGTLG